MYAVTNPSVRMNRAQNVLQELSVIHHCTIAIGQFHRASPVLGLLGIVVIFAPLCIVRRCRRS
jgi:hypothetical protein